MCCDYHHVVALCSLLKEIMFNLWIGGLCVSTIIPMEAAPLPFSFKSRASRTEQLPAPMIFLHTVLVHQLCGEPSPASFFVICSGPQTANSHSGRRAIVQPVSACPRWLCHRTVHFVHSMFCSSFFFLPSFDCTAVEHLRSAVKKKST